MSKKTFILGAALGSIIGLLLAPKTGKKTREDIRRKTQPMLNKLSAEMQKVKNLNRRDYERMVDKYVGRPLKKAKVAKNTADAVVEDLKNQWKEVNKSSAKKKTAKKPARKKK